ncbi:MAG: Rid family detoxifying hydrolase [Verrucomicrobiota bacterium]
MAEKMIVNAAGAPPAVGPYNHAVRVGEMLYCSGQIPLDPADPKAPFPEDVTAQSERVLKNIGLVLADQSLDYTNVVKCTVFLTDLSDFAAMNAVYQQYFTADFPARSTIQVAGLPLGAKVEIEIIAHY